MSKTKDVFLSLGGAVLVGVVVYFLDKYLSIQATNAANNAASNATDLSSVQLPNIATATVSLQATTPSSTSSTSGSCDTCSTVSSAPTSGTPTTVNNSQQQIDNLMSTLENNYMTNAVPTSTVPIAAPSFSATLPAAPNLQSASVQAITATVQ